jgi:hypothetical protein
MGVFSKIVAIADSFDAATTRRVYQKIPWSPAEVMREMRDNPRRGMDPVILKAFINLTGVYPVGTLVVLDTFELAIVNAVNPIAGMLRAPSLRIIADALGNLSPGALAATSPTETRMACGNFTTIIKTKTRNDMASGSATISSDVIARRFAELRASAALVPATSRPEVPGRGANGRADARGSRTPARDVIGGSACLRPDGRRSGDSG